MAKIPLYQQKVEQTATSAMPVMDASGVSSAWRQAGEGFQAMGQGISAVGKAWQDVERKREAQTDGVAEAEYQLSFTRQKKEMENLDLSLQASGRKITAEDLKKLESKFEEERNQLLGRMSKKHRELRSVDHEARREMFAIDNQNYLLRRDIEEKNKAFMVNVKEAANAGNFEDARGLIESGSGFLDAKQVYDLGVFVDKTEKNYLQERQKDSLTTGIAMDPSGTLALLEQQQRGEASHFNLDADELNKWTTSARTASNRQSADNSTAMHERFYGVLYGKDQEDDFVAIERDLDNLFELGKIKPEDYNGLKQKLKNPHGRTEAMPPDELHSVWSEVTSYDVEFDEGYREAARLWSTINSVPNAQDRSLLSKLMVSRENNEPKSPYWDELDFRINADSKRDMFGQTAVKPETTVLARREVARFLMENPRDLDGATKLYEDIVANDKKTHVREEYRRKYSYGLSAEQRAMRDAGPTVLEHRRANEAAKKRGQSQYVLNGVSYEVQ